MEWPSTHCRLPSSEAPQTDRKVKMGSVTNTQLFGPSGTVPLWLDGEQITTESSFDIISPRSGEHLFKSSAASVDDVTRAVASAQTAFKTWSKTTAAERRDIILRAADILKRRKDEFFEITHYETGENYGMLNFEHGLALEACKTVAGLISAVTGTVPVAGEKGRSAIILQEPYGVVLSIAPWNAPYILGMRAIIGPLAMGNTVIFKCSESSPATHWAIVSALYEAGLPKGCVNTIIHRPQDAAVITLALIESPAVRKINFTGSTRVGSIIASQAARLLKPSVMELGGKAPAIVCSDADIEKAAAGCAEGRLTNHGQVCMCTERIIVHSSVVDKFKSAFQKYLDQHYADPQGLILVNEIAVKKNKDLIQDAVAKGAKIVYGDGDTSTVDKKTAMKPVVVENVNQDMDIYHLESFGPTVSIYVVDSDEEAIALANDTDYGLAAAVFTEDLRKGLHIAKQIQSGAVQINSKSIHDDMNITHGGWKSSGFGRFNSIDGLREWVQTKSITWRD